MYKFSSPSTCTQAGGGKKYASRKDGEGGGQQAKMGGRRHMACYGYGGTSSYYGY